MIRVRDLAEALSILVEGLVLAVQDLMAAHRGR